LNNWAHSITAGFLKMVIEIHVREHLLFRTGGEGAG